MSKKTLVAILTAFVLVFSTTVFLYKLETNSSYEEIYVVVKEGLLVKTLSDQNFPYDEFYLNIDDNLKEGDILRIQIKDILEIYPPLINLNSYEIVYARE